MRIMMKNGNVLSMKKAIAVTEQRVAYNGRDIRLCEATHDISDANAIAFLSEAGVQDICDVTTGGAVLIGNLSNEFVRGVLSSLVRQGYVDLSDLKFQKTQPLSSNYVFDHGASGAYILQGYETSACVSGFPGYPFGGVPVANGANNAVSEAEDTEEDEEEDGDE